MKTQIYTPTRIKIVLFVLINTTLFHLGHSQNISPLDTINGIDGYTFGTSKINYLPLDSDTRTQNWFKMKNPNQSPYFLGYLSQEVEIGFRKEKLTEINISFYMKVGGGLADKIMNRALSQYGKYSENIVTPDCVMFVWIGANTTLTLRFRRESFLDDNYNSSMDGMFTWDATISRKMNSKK